MSLCCPRICANPYNDTSNAVNSRTSYPYLQQSVQDMPQSPAAGSSTQSNLPRLKPTVAPEVLFGIAWHKPQVHLHRHQLRHLRSSNVHQTSFHPSELPRNLLAHLEVNIRHHGFRRISPLRFLLRHQRRLFSPYLGLQQVRQNGLNLHPSSLPRLSQSCLRRRVRGKKFPLRATNR